MRFPGILPAATTPFDSGGAVDPAALERNVNWMLDAGCAGIVGTGTMGEAASLSQAERNVVLATIVAAVAGRGPVVAGVSAETTAHAAAMAREAANAGVDAVMCLPPTNYAADERELVAHFEVVASATDLPLIVYNSPSACRNDLTPAFLVELVARVDRVAAIKETSGDARRITELRALLDERVEVLVGGDDCALEGFAGGATGWISGVAVVIPDACVALHEACANGDFTRARELFRPLLALAQLDMTPKLVQYFKAGMDAVGREGGPTRPPRLPLDAAERLRLDAAIAALGS